jgi:hypothetical protein
MTHWIGVVILIAAFAFIVLAFRQGTKVKPDKRPDDWAGRFSNWWDDTGT